MAQADENARIRSYLLSQGEKYSFKEMWQRVVAARLELLEAIGSVNEEQASFRPAEGEWSVREVILHVLNWSREVRRLVQLLANGEAAGSRTIGSPRQEADLTIGQLRSQLLEDSLAWSVLTADLPDAPSFVATAPHPMFGELHTRAWYLFQRVHDLDHARQIQAIRQTPGYPTG